jgi:uncharacterized protein
MMMPRNAFSRAARSIAVAGVIVLGAASSAASHAATFPDLATVTVIPGPDARDPRAESERLAMMQLLTRMTGRRDAAQAPELAHLIADVRSYVNSWGYLDRERMRVGFNSTAVTNELTRANWPVWGAERPLTLLWIAVDFGDSQRALMGASPVAAEWTPEFAEFMLDLREQLDAVASERGLPVTYPLLDLQDLDAITFAEVWGGFDGLIMAASERYNADAVLVGRVAVSSFGLDVRWTLLDESRGAVLGTDIRGGLDWLADQYAAEFAVVGGARSTRVTVLDVTSLEAYGRVMSYLESLTVLQSVDVEGFDGSTLNLRIAARGDDRVVERLLTLGGVLATAPVPEFSAPADSLVFRVAGSRPEQ